MPGLDGRLDLRWRIDCAALIAAWDWSQRDQGRASWPWADAPRIFSAKNLDRSAMEW